MMVLFDAISQNEPDRDDLNTLIKEDEIIIDQYRRFEQMMSDCVEEEAEEKQPGQGKGSLKHLLTLAIFTGSLFADESP